MAATQADLDAIDAAIKNNTKVVRFADRSQEFRDMDDLLKARSLIYSQLNQGQPVRRQYRAYTEKGM